jgi:hypothetical protein
MSSAFSLTSGSEARTEMAFPLNLSIHHDLRASAGVLVDAISESIQTKYRHRGQVAVKLFVDIPSPEVSAALAELEFKLPFLGWRLTRYVHGKWTAAERSLHTKM